MGTFIGDGDHCGPLYGGRHVRLPHTGASMAAHVGLFTGGKYVSFPHTGAAVWVYGPGLAPRIAPGRSPDAKRLSRPPPGCQKVSRTRGDKEEERILRALLRQ